jgi:hypothetical protein
MRRLASSALVAALLMPAVALAEGAPPPAWSIGGGVTLSLFGTGVSTTLGPAGVYTTSFNASTPSVSASLERRSGKRTWFMFGLSGGTVRSEMDPPTSGTFYESTTEQRVTRAFASVGLRRVITPVDAPVDFSIIGAVEGGFARVDETIIASSGGEVEATYRSRIIGVTGGIAVDRTLAGSLSLRIATPLVTASYASVTNAATGQPDRDGSAAGVDVVLAPRLELRIAF